MPPDIRNSDPLKFGPPPKIRRQKCGRCRRILKILPISGKNQAKISLSLPELYLTLSCSKTFRENTVSARVCRGVWVYLQNLRGSRTCFTVFILSIIIRRCSSDYNCEIILSIQNLVVVLHKRNFSSSISKSTW